MYWTDANSNLAGYFSWCELFEGLHRMRCWPALSGAGYWVVWCDWKDGSCAGKARSMWIGAVWVFSYQSWAIRPMAQDWIAPETHDPVLCWVVRLVWKRVIGSISESVRTEISVHSSILRAETSTTSTSMVPGGVRRWKLPPSTCKGSPQLGQASWLLFKPASS